MTIIIIMIGLSVRSVVLFDIYNGMLVILIIIISVFLKMKIWTFEINFVFIYAISSLWLIIIFSTIRTKNRRFIIFIRPKKKINMISLLGYLKYFIYCFRDQS